ncbi:MAG: hypothetical protein GXY76_14825 [Chloroflexi bacterium]|nr:hypothetical protein [Chloroflexota bacterium]
MAGCGVPSCRPGSPGNRPRTARPARRPYGGAASHRCPRQRA